MKNKLNLLTTTEAAKILSINPKSLGRLFRCGKIAGIKIANRWLIEEATLQEFGKNYIGKKGRPKGYSPGRRKT
jgi:excisionase family DNA binding protein